MHVLVGIVLLVSALAGVRLLDGTVIGSFGHVGNEAYRRVAWPAEAQLIMRRHEQNGVGAGGPGGLRVLNGHPAALRSTRHNHSYQCECLSRTQVRYGGGANGAARLRNATPYLKRGIRGRGRPFDMHP